MRHLVLVSLAALPLVACGGGQAASPQTSAEAPQASAGEVAPETAGEAAETAEEGSADANTFVLRTSAPANKTEAQHASKIQPSATQAALKFTVIDKDKGPIPGIVVSLTAPDGTKFYTEETDAEGYAEVLVPVGQKYELVFLSLGRRQIAANVSVTDEPNQNLRLTLRYKRIDPPKPETEGATPAPGFVLSGVTFDTGKATIQPESFPRLDSVVEYMTYKKSARIEISGHTDNVGNRKMNKKLSEKRAQACRDYLIQKGIDGSRIVAVGYGDERPIASNDTEEGRQKNRRIEAIEL